MKRGEGEYGNKGENRRIGKEMVVKDDQENSDQDM